MQENSRIYVAGHRGLVGSALTKHLRKKNKHVVTVGKEDLDLRKRDDVHQWIEDVSPEFVVLAAAKVGGIKANNNFPVDFIEDNLRIQINIISAAAKHKVKKLIFLGSSCIYPKLAQQPIKEEYLMTGSLEPTNSAYATAKIAGIELCKSYNRQYATNFITAMPTNLYGKNDNFDLETSHVLPALIRKFHDAKIQKRKSVVLWGTGKPLREFLYVEDLADALVFMLYNVDIKNGLIWNVGTGKDISIFNLANLVKDIVGFSGNIIWDSSMPDGTPRKLLDVSRLRSMGWEAKTPLETGIKETYAWYKSTQEKT